MANSIGVMRHRVEIQARDETDDSYGGRATDWDAVTTVWAQVTPLNGNERLAAMQIESPINYTVTIRNYPGLTTKHRLAWGAVVLNIRSIRNVDERNTFMTLDCEAGVA